MEKMKAILKKANIKRKAEEITPDVVKDVLDRVATFSQDKKVVKRVKETVADITDFSYHLTKDVTKKAKRGIESIRNEKSGDNMRE